MIVSFHRAEQPLMTQVGYGIGDISTAEKRKLAAGTDLDPPSWPDSPWGRVAAAAWHGRCDVFTDFLRPVLRDCAESVTYVAEPNLAESACRLSDIAFRACLADREGPVDLLARGLAALWFERDLTRLAGALPRDLESAETALAAVARRRTDPRAEANASAVVVRVLLEAGTLHRRGISEARRTVSLWQHLAADLDGPVSSTSDTSGHDLQRLSDAASHLGLTAARYGDRRTASDAWQLSRRIARQGLGHDQSRVARADNNLAALAAETGHGEQAGTVIAGVRQTRLALLERQPQDAAAWRRLTVADRTRTEVARLGGEAIQSVRLAADLLADRQTRLGDPGHADTCRGPDRPGPGPAGGRSSGRRAASSGGGRRHPAQPVPAHLLPGPGRPHLAGQGGAGAQAPADRARAAGRTGGGDRLVPRPGVVPARLHRAAAARAGQRRARPGRRGGAPPCSPTGRNSATGRWTPGLTRWPPTSTVPWPNSRCCAGRPPTPRAG